MKIMMKIITAKLIIMKSQSYARIPSISHLLIIFVKNSGNNYEDYDENNNSKIDHHEKPIIR